MSTTAILGGGFGGIMAANVLRTLVPGEHEILVIDESTRFHVGAGKTWIMLGERTFEQISEARTALLEPGIRVLQANVQGISLSDHTVSTSATSVRWDYLVIALGAELHMAAVPGLAEAAHTFYTVEGAQRLYLGGDNDDRAKPPLVAQLR